MKMSNNKGVTPIISSVLMITVVVAAMILVISTSETIITARNAQMGEKLCVEKVSFSPTQITVQLRNIGHGFLTLEQAIVNKQLYIIDRVVLPDPEANPTGQTTIVTIQGTFSKGMYSISFISNLNKDLGIVEVTYQ